jgi:hypothetical protein
MKIELKTGESFEFEEFKLEDSNLRKINVDFDGVDSEGLWAYFSDEAIVKHDSDSVDGDTVVVLANSPLFAYPYNFWGVYVPVKFRGTLRPYCNIANLKGSPIFHSICEGKSKKI